MARQTRTPAERAQEALDVASRRVKRLGADVDKHRRAMEASQAELREAKANRDYLALNPALQQPTGDTSASASSISSTPEG